MRIHNPSFWSAWLDEGPVNKFDIGHKGSQLPAEVHALVKTVQIVRARLFKYLRRFLTWRD